MITGLSALLGSISCCCGCAASYFGVSTLWRQWETGPLIDQITDRCLAENRSFKISQGLFSTFVKVEATNYFDVSTLCRQWETSPLINQFMDRYLAENRTFEISQGLFSTFVKAEATNYLGDSTLCRQWKTGLLINQISNRCLAENRTFEISQDLFSTFVKVEAATAPRRTNDGLFSTFVKVEATTAPAVQMMVDPATSTTTSMTVHGKYKMKEDVTPELFPISAPKYDFEYPVPKIGDEYGGFNLVFDADKNPCFRWPLRHGIKAAQGCYLPVHKLLFPRPRRRNFLINNSGHKFDAAHLDGKILVILILSLRPEEQEKTKHFTGVLREAYMELRNRRDIGFEVVFVAAEGSPGGGGGLEEQFDALFKIMPWLAIPYSDKHARQICEESLHGPVCYGPVSCFILQTNGFIVHDWPAIFTIYGAKAFPFTSQRLEELENQNLSYFTNPPSMKELLGDSVVSPQGDQVLSAHLENKVVGLFFPVDPIINAQLVSAWEALKSRHGDFEIVCVPEPYSVSSNPYQKGSFPFSSLSDTSLRQKLWWIYHPPLRQGFCSNADQHPGVLVIIGPQHSRFFNYYGADILYKFGAEGYPFTLERAAELEQEKLEKLTLDSLLGREELVCAADRKKLRDTYVFEDLVGWRCLSPDRKLTLVEYI